jgi:hypothetical protein
MCVGPSKRQFAPNAPIRSVAVPHSLLPSDSSRSLPATMASGAHTLCQLVPVWQAYPASKRYDDIDNLPTPGPAPFRQVSDSRFVRAGILMLVADVLQPPSSRRDRRSRAASRRVVAAPEFHRRQQSHGVCQCLRPLDLSTCSIAAGRIQADCPKPVEAKKGEHYIAVTRST